MDGHQKRPWASKQGVKIIDCVFDIDGTLADATHRLHFIKKPPFLIDGSPNPEKPDWDGFLADEQVGKDLPMPATWNLLTKFLHSDRDRVIFITGRSDKTRDMTEEWLCDTDCNIRASAAWQLIEFGMDIYMRKEGDRRESHVVKRELLHKARFDGYNPELVFEDRRSEARMWREEGLLCCHVAEGDY